MSFETSSTYYQIGLSGKNSRARSIDRGNHLAVDTAVSAFVHAAGIGVKNKLMFKQRFNKRTDGVMDDAVGKRRRGNAPKLRVINKNCRWLPGFQVPFSKLRLISIRRMSISAQKRATGRRSSLPRLANFQARASIQANPAPEQNNYFTERWSLTNRKDGYRLGCRFPPKVGEITNQTAVEGGERFCRVINSVSVLPTS